MPSESEKVKAGGGFASRIAAIQIANPGRPHLSVVDKAPPKEETEEERQRRRIEDLEKKVDEAPSKEETKEERQRRRIEDLEKKIADENEYESRPAKERRTILGTAAKLLQIKGRDGTNDEGRSRVKISRQPLVVGSEAIAEDLASYFVREIMQYTPIKLDGKRHLVPSGVEEITKGYWREVIPEFARYKVLIAGCRQAQSIGQFYRPTPAEYCEYDVIPGRNGEPADPVTGKLNLWKPYPLASLARAMPIDEAEKRAQPLLCYIRDHLSNGDAKVGEWLLDWVAYSLQFPGAEDKQGTAIAINGPQGSGKGTFFAILRKLVGRSKSLTTARGEDLIKWSADLTGKLFVQLDEAAFAKDRKLFDQIKSVITEEIGHASKKGVDSRQMPQTARLITLSNHFHVIQMEVGDRRWLVLYLNDKRKGDAEYWKDLYAHINDEDAIAALLRVLLARPVSRSTVSRPPATKAGRDQKLLSAEPLVKWAMARFDRDGVPANGRPYSYVAPGGLCANHELVQDAVTYLSEAAKNSHDAPAADIDLMMRLRDQLPNFAAAIKRASGDKQIKVTIGDRRVLAKRLPTRDDWARALAADGYPVTDDDDDETAVPSTIVSAEQTADGKDRTIVDDELVGEELDHALDGELDKIERQKESSK